MASACDFLRAASPRCLTDQAVDLGANLGVVELVLGLALELGLVDEDRDQHHKALANVVGCQLHASRKGDVVGLEPAPDGLADCVAKTLDVGAAVLRGDAVDEAADALPGGVGPGERDVEPGVGGPAEHKGAIHHRSDPGGLDDPIQVVGNPTLVLQLDTAVARLVLEDDLQALVEEGADLQALPDGVGVEDLVAEDLRVWGSWMVVPEPRALQPPSAAGAPSRAGRLCGVPCRRGAPAPRGARSTR